MQEELDRQLERFLHTFIGPMDVDDRVTDHYPSSPVFDCVELYFCVCVMGGTSDIQIHPGEPQNEDGFFRAVHGALMRCCNVILLNEPSF